MTVKVTGTYTVKLTVNNGIASSFDQKGIAVSPSGNVTFSSIVSTLSSAGCLGCHGYGSLTGIYNTASQIGVAPPWDSANTAEGDTLYQRIRQRTDVASPASSLLLVCPHSGCGGMGAQAPFSATTSGTDYDNFLKWITDGAPPD